MVGAVAGTSGDWSDRYGPWAAIAGASEGLGAAFAEALAARGLNLLLMARRAEVLADVASRIEAQHGVETRCLAIDMGDPELGPALDEASSGLELGLLVYNAAFAPVGSFLDLPEASLSQVVDVNVRGPVLFVRRLAPALRARGRGGVILMSSLSGLQGSPRIASYAASKAFNTTLGEGLWGELRGDGVDVLVSCAGAIRTPGYAGTSTREAPGTLDPEVVVSRTLDALGRGPRVVPGWMNGLAALLTGRLLSRRMAIRLMAANTKDLT